jgi:hypothetical protein
MLFIVLRYDTCIQYSTVPNKLGGFGERHLTKRPRTESALLQKPAADASKDEPRTDFALGYDWADVRDEGEEGPSLLAAPHGTLL